MNPKEEVKNSLEALKNSPIVKNDDFRVQMENLCGVVSRLIGEIHREIEEDLEKKLKNNRLDLVTEGLNSLTYRLFEIETIVDVIKDKATHPDFEEICDLVYFLREIEKDEHSKINSHD
jgi:hypothetical protein